MSFAAEAVAFAQQAAGEQVMKLFSVDQLQPEDMASPDDHGYFGPGSIIWRVHGDQSSLIGGFRALFMQSLHVRAMELFGDHTDVYEDPLGRLQRTTQFVVMTTYGNTVAADRMIERIRSVHSRVNGFDQQGNPISANDPDLLLWVHNTLAEGFLYAFENYGYGKLTDAEKDQYVSEFAVIGRKLGAEGVPESVAELRASMESLDHELGESEKGRNGARFLLKPPGMPLPILAGYSVLTLVAVGSLPKRARQILHIPAPPGAEVAVRPVATLFARTLGWMVEGASGESNFAA